MTKFAVPTVEEIRDYPLNQEILRYLDAYAARAGKPRDQVRTLDWGCGRGEVVACLLERGYDARGADILQSAVDYGTEYFRRIGDPQAEERLGLISPDSTLAEAASGSFDYIFSQTVFEHVARLDEVAAELFRLLKPAGESFHVFPAHRHLVEQHLEMPFVHWLPKNGLRRALIGFWVRAGREPHWVEEPRVQRVERYTNYSNSSTFYRPPAQIRRTFEDAGFTVEFVTLQHPKLAENPALRPVQRIPPLRAALRWAVESFHVVELRLVKPVAF